jgi:malonate-semialdehyde dehydrogenase (acetylating)/methylmalonate-semialdehyde dehydrogenase
MLSRDLRVIRSLSRTFSTAPPKVKNFINGVFEDSKTDRWIDVINPATQEVVCRVPQSTPEELKRAEAGAIEAFKTWRDVPIQQRQVRVHNYSRFFYLMLISIVENLWELRSIDS